MLGALSNLLAGVSDRLYPPNTFPPDCLVHFLVSHTHFGQFDLQMV